MAAKGAVGIAKDVIRIEADALVALLPKIGREFEKACELILKSKGRVVVTGMASLVLSHKRYPPRFLPQVPLLYFYIRQKLSMGIWDAS